MEDSIMTFFPEFHPGSYPTALISVALTGAVPSRSKYPQLPITPKEIAADALACAQLGAQIVHIHMRDFDGRPSQDANLFRDTIERIRSENPGLIICATTTSRGTSSIEDRLAPLRLPDDSLPDLVSLTLGSYNTPFGVNANPTEEIRMISQEAQDRGISVEAEIFELGMIANYYRLASTGKLQKPSIFNLLLGVDGAMPADAQSLTQAINLLPIGAEWAGAGIGHFQHPVTLLSLVIGGNIRIGMEDDPRGEGEGWSNQKAVSRALRMLETAHRKLATLEEARERLGIATR